MAYLKHLNSFSADTGELKVFENLLPGEIKRVFYINNVPENAVRGKHRHHKTWQALICIAGSCRIYVDDNSSKKVFELNTDSKCLIIEPKDWHMMDNFSENCILLVIANEKYDVLDYIDKPYSEIDFSLLEPQLMAV